MTKLTDTQLIVLSAGAQREHLVALPLPSNLKGGAATKVIQPLIDKGLLAEVDAPQKQGVPVWRKTEDGRETTLVVTEAGLAVLELAPDTAPKTAADGEELPHTDLKARATDAPKPKLRPGTKQAALIEMLRAPGGATIAEIVAATGWQAHTARGAIAGALKKKLGLSIASEKDAARGRVYRLLD